jgi:hypothetical protein
MKLCKIWSYIYHVYLFWFFVHTLPQQIMCFGLKFAEIGSILQAGLA